MTRFSLRDSRSLNFGISAQRKAYLPERSDAIFIWLTLIGIFFPPFLVSVGGINIWPGRFTAILLLVPALGVLFGKGRRRVASDLFIVLLGIWILTASSFNGGFRPYVGAEALELLGAYFAGRAFFFGRTNLQTFVRALERIAFVLIAFAVIDILSGRYLILDIFGVENITATRFGIIRASSVFETAEHYGTFCAVAASVFLYSERGPRRIWYVSLAFFGCALSLSSGPIMGLGIVVATFGYNLLLKRYEWRWKALVAGLATFTALIFATHDRPIEWIIVHATLDPATGFFRINTWNQALPLIDGSKLIGRGLTDLTLGSAEAQIYLRSVDCVWLVEALRYGLPAVAFLFLAMFWPFSTRRILNDSLVYTCGTGLSVAVITMGIIGLTVHYWDATWLLLYLCIGIRASVSEYEISARRLGGYQMSSNVLPVAATAMR